MLLLRLNTDLLNLKGVYLLITDGPVYRKRNVFLTVNFLISRKEVHSLTRAVQSAPRKCTY